MRIVLSPLGVYIARILTLLCAPSAFALFSRPEGMRGFILGMMGGMAVFGAIAFFTDFRVRSAAHEEATIDIGASLRSKRFWEIVGLTLASVGVVYAVAIWLGWNFQRELGGVLTWILLSHLSGLDKRTNTFANPYVSFRRNQT